jgi:murein DD-endopeptidase MepM/ murein hydrolase activator NlpD
MQLILLSKHRGHLAQLHLGSRRVCFSLVGLALLVCAAVFYGGFRAAGAFGIAQPGDAQVSQWRAQLQQQQEAVVATRRLLQQNVDALALRLGEMNAHVVRLDALGSRLTQMAGLEDGEFDFTQPPSLGGPEELVTDGESARLGGVQSALDALGQQLDDRSRQLGVLEDLLINRKLQDEVHPEGRPVKSGYISSGFGARTDPFTGRRAFHKGLDFAGRKGSDVLAVGSGVVTWSGPRYGYGRMVEVNHGNGYVTRYAHNTDITVAVGDTVKRGQTIAHMGSTGRATGPNLHFEVLHNGRAVDPRTYIK